MTTLPLCDPHFHMWNLDDRPNPNLGPEAEELLRAYGAEDYDADAATLPPRLNLVSRVHVETVVGQMEGGPVVDTVSESEWVCAQVEPTQAERPSYLVAYLNLAGDPAAAERTLERHIEASSSRLRGVRMILNHHPGNPALTWPQVERGDFLGDPVFRESIALLGERGISFDLQCNPHQLADAATAFADHPDTPVVIGHLASFHDGGESGYERMWREGLEAMAALPHVSIKLSMVFFCAPGYHEDAAQEARARDLVRQAIDIFGAGRCMFASNYPVDGVQGIDIPTLYGRFLDWTADLPPADRASLFHDTAARVYRLKELT